MGKPGPHRLLVVAAEAGERCLLNRADAVCCGFQGLQAVFGRADEDDPLVLGSALEQAGGLEPEDGGVHGLPGDLGDAREFGSR